METLYQRTMNITENETISKPGIWDEDYRVLQSFWDLRIGYEGYVASPLFPIILSVLFYFVNVIPWMIIDLYGENWTWITKYKIQPTKRLTWPMARKAIYLTIWNQVLYILPISIMQWVFDPPMFLPQLAPTLWEIVWQLTLELIIFDFEYFAWHSSHHKIKFLYKYVHSVHHQYTATTSWVTQYMHPWELISVGIFTATTPRIFNSHPITYMLFLQWSIIVSVEAHIGYDLPICFNNLTSMGASWWGGSTKHDMHHQRPMTNFAPFYNWWDRILGSYCPGVLAGGVKPKALLDWEKRHKELKAQKREEKLRKEQQNGHANGHANGYANGKISNGYANGTTSNGYANGKISNGHANGKISNGFH